MLACLVLNCPFFITVPNCPRCQIVRFSLRCQIVRGAKLSTLHCGAKLSAVPNCPLYTLGAKLSGAKLSAVPNCPRCQIVRGAKLSYNLKNWGKRPSWGVSKTCNCTRTFQSVSLGQYPFQVLFGGVGQEKATVRKLGSLIHLEKLYNTNIYTWLSETSSPDAFLSIEKYIALRY